MINSLDSHIHCLKDFLAHLSGFRYSNPVVIKELIPLLNNYLDFVNKLHNNFKNEDANAVSDFEALCYKIIELVRKFSLQLHYALLPNSPTWFYPFLMSVHQKIMNENSVHLISAPLETGSDQLRFSSIRLFEGLKRNTNELLIFYREQCQDLDRQERKAIKKLIKYLESNNADIAIQIIPWDTIEHPHYSVVTFHELGHHIFNNFSNSKGSVSMQVEKLTQDTLHDNNYSLGEYEIDPRFQRVLYSQIEELFCDLIAMYISGPMMYIVERDIICNLDEDNDIDRFECFADIEQLWPVGADHPAKLLRLSLVTKMLNKRFMMKDLERSFSLGSLYKSSLKVDRDVIVAFNNLIWGEMHSRIYESYHGFIQSLAKINLILYDLVDSIDELVYSILDNCNLTSIMMTDEMIDDCENYTNNSIPATNLFTEHACIAIPYSCMMAVAYKKFRYLDRKNNNKRIAYSDYRINAEIIKKTIEDIGVINEYGNIIYS